MTKQPFKNLIGQDLAKNRLSFAIQAHEAGCPIPHFLFTGAMGNGKSQFAREFAKNLYDKGERRKYFEVNASTVKNLTQFVEKICMPYVIDNQSTLLVDEMHCLPKDVSMFLLTVLNTEKSPIRRVSYGDSELEFDFTRQSIHFATTEPHTIFKPLKNRMEVLALGNYKLEELEKIIQLNVPDIDFEDNVLADVVSSIKGNPRSAVQTARKISDFCSIKGRKSFDSGDFANLCKMADIKAHGLDNIEIGVLKLLAERGEMSLTEISACLSISSSALRQDHEHHLLRKGFMRINGKREITAKGREACKLFTGGSFT